MKSKKNYLNGIDWAMNSIHSHSVKKIGTANDFIIVLELNGILNLAELSSHIEKFINKFPALTAKIHRDLINLAPYWKPEKRRIFAKNILSFIPLTKEKKLFEHIQEFCNEFMNDEHILFRLFYNDKKSRLAIKFDHRTFDGRGAESFLSLLQREWLGKDIYLNSNNKNKESHLNKWIEKLNSGKLLNRRMIKLLDNTHPANISNTGSDTKKLSYSYIHIEYDKNDTLNIINNSNREAGLFMLMPYLLVKFVKVFHNITKSKGINSGDYIIPVTIDQRTNEEVLKNTFSNNWSFLFFKILRKDMEKPDTFLIKDIKKQMLENLKDKYPMHMVNVNYLMRILPTPLMYKLTNKFLKGTGGSFSFSLLKDNVFEFDTFMDIPVLNLYHIPNVPMHPGTGLFFSSYNGKMNAVFSYISSLLNQSELESIRGKLNYLRHPK